MGDNPMVNFPSSMENNNPDITSNILPNTEILQETNVGNSIPTVNPVIENQEPNPVSPLEKIEEDITNLRSGRELIQLTEGEKALLAELMREKNILLETQTEEVIPQNKPEQITPIPEVAIPQQEEIKVETPPTVVDINTNPSNNSPEVQGYIEKLPTSTDGSL
jgi:hypothetical protein